MIGGGSKKILEFAGQEADIVSLNFNNRAGMLGPDGMASGLADATAKKIEWVRNGAGGRFDDIELEIGAYNTIITDHQEPTAAAIGDALGMSAGDILSHPALPDRQRRLSSARNWSVAARPTASPMSPCWTTAKTTWSRPSRPSSHSPFRQVTHRQTDNT